MTYKIHTIMEELTAYNTDIALITETGLNTNTYRDRKMMAAAEKKGYKLITGPYIDNKASHLLFIARKELHIGN